MIGRHPVEVLEDGVRCCCQRDADTAGDDVADGDPDIGIGLEAVDPLHPLLRGLLPGDGDRRLTKRLLVTHDPIVGAPAILGGQRYDVLK